MIVNDKIEHFRPKSHFLNFEFLRYYLVVFTTETISRLS